MLRGYLLLRLALGLSGAALLTLLLCAAAPQNQNQRGNAQAPQAHAQPAKAEESAHPTPVRATRPTKGDNKADKRNTQVSNNGRSRIFQAVNSFATHWRDAFDILFAALVALFTAVSGTVSFFQLRELGTSQRMTLAALKIARAEASASSEAARAAKRSATAAEQMIDSIERPYVYPADMRFHVNQRFNGVDQAPFVSVRFKNYGRSPAVLSEATLQVSIQANRLDERSYYSRLMDFSLYGMIGREEFSEEIKLPPAEEITRHLQDIATGKKILTLRVTIKIDTVTGGYTTRSALYRWHPHEGKFVHGI